MAENKSTTQQPTQQPWSGKTDGTKGMQQTLIVIFRYVDVRFFYPILAIVILFYMLLRHSGYRAQYYLFHQRLHQRPLRAFCNVYRNHFQFGQVVLDRFAAYAGRHYNLILNGNELFQQYTAQQQGVIMLFSHVGNFEMAGYALQSPKPMHILAYSGDTETVMQNRAKMFCPNHINIIPIASDLSHIYLINNALQQGEIVCMAGDRRMPNQRSIACSILGETASLPEGPFRIAATEKLPTIAAFAMKERWNTYHVYFLPIHIDTSLSRNELEQDILTQYAHHIETMVQRYPLQWYHYFDFWAKE